MPRGEAKTSPRRIQAVLKQRRALELRMAGQTYEVIAKTLGWKTPQGAIWAVQAALKKTLRPAADQWRALTIERLTKILAVFWPKMLQGDAEAARQCFEAITDLRQLLGLDAPTKSTAVGLYGTMALGDKEKRDDFNAESFAELFRGFLAAGPGDGVPSPDGIGEPLDTGDADP